MAKRDFPELIHVTAEQEGDEKYLIAHLDGVLGPAVAGKIVECAIYRLIQVGRVVAPPSFQE